MGGIVLTNAISQARQLQLTAGEHILAGTPAASATKALLRLGNAIVGSDAQGTYLGINADGAYAGSLVHIQQGGGAPALSIRAGGSGVAKVGIGVLSNLGYRVQVQGNANDVVDGSIAVTNLNDGSSAAALVSFTVGTSDSASGFFGAFSPAAASALRANRIVLATNSDAGGISFLAETSGQDMRFSMSGLGEQLRLSSSGELLLGTTSSLARMAVVGRADQIQLLVRGSSPQTNQVFRVENSSGTSLFNMNNTGTGTFNAGVVCTSAQITNTAAAVNRFGGAASAGAMLSVISGLAASNALAVRGIASQSGELIALRQLSSTSTDREVGFIDGVFAVATDASRTGRLVLSAVDFNATREFLRGEADGTNSLIGFLGATAVGIQSVGAAATDAATTQTLANNMRAALIAFGLCTT